MRINKKIFAGMAVLALLFGLLLSGCLSPSLMIKESMEKLAIKLNGTLITYVETETSKAIFAAVSEITSLKEHKNQRGEVSYYELGRKITANELVSELGKKFSGLTLQVVDGGGIALNYQGKVYRISCSLGGGPIVGKNSTIELIQFVKEKEDPAQSAE